MKIKILAQEESFYLPNLVAQLARAENIAGVGIITFQDPLPKRIRKLKVILTSLGFRGVLASGLSAGLARVANLVFPHKYYSLAKVCSAFGLKTACFYGFQDPNLGDFLAGSEPVLVQVDRKVPANLVQQYTLWNKHASPLPADKGILPVFWIKLHGAGPQGVTIHEMSEDFDSGKILAMMTVEDRANSSVFATYHHLYERSFYLLRELIQAEKPNYQPEAATITPSYHSWPTSENLNEFYALGHKLGFPFRLHVDVPGSAINQEKQSFSQK